MMKNTP